MQPLVPLIENLNNYLYQPISNIGRTIADEMKTVYDEMKNLGLISDLGDKFDIFLRYVQSEWIDYENEQTIFDQIKSHVNDMTSTINEGDLVNSQELVSERVFIMTIYKGKGLEFENVVLLGANDGTYPFFTVNKILGAPWRHTPEEVANAEQDRMEDARKFYVGLSRAKKRLCVSYSYQNSYGFPTDMTPFMNSIKNYFYSSSKRS